MNINIISAFGMPGDKKRKTNLSKTPTRKDHSIGKLVSVPDTSGPILTN